MKTIISTIAAALALFLFEPVSISTAEATIVGSRPAGCPARYCGCATARKVGLRGAKWNLAANYLTLPRASCAPGMVAARRGHVFVIQVCHGNGTVTAWDPNSGGGKTRIHKRSLRGYTVVNPHGVAVAKPKASSKSKVAWWKPWPHHSLGNQTVTPRRSHRAPRRHYQRQAQR